jgi:GNAT superfamily N-acetyltransferase
MRLRRANKADLQFLRQMIVQAAFPPGRIPPFEEAVRAPHVAPWIEDWMRHGDLGIVAEEDLPVGAAWCRRFSGHEVALSGFVDRETPVLAIAVVEDRRGQGIGTALIEEIIAQARAEGVRTMSLSAGRTNSALRLYERLGWERLGDAPEGPLRLLRHL